MKRIIKYILLSLLLIFPNLSKAITKFENESLDYEIIYHWGIIWKHAAQANLKLVNDSNKYHSELSAKTISWADRFFSVRDTLSCSIQKEGLRPLKYRKASHEGRHKGVDIVEYSYPDSQCNAKCTRIRPKKEPTVKYLTSDEQAYDMLSVFYYIRTLDYDKMQPNEIIKTIVYSGKKKEILTIKYIGQEEIELRDKSKHQTNHIQFMFTQADQKMSSDDMDTWISVDDKHIPLMMRGKLPIGEVRCYYAKK